MYLKLIVVFLLLINFCFTDYGNHTQNHSYNDIQNSTDTINDDNNTNETNNNTNTTDTIPRINFTEIDEKIVQGLEHPTPNNNSNFIELTQYYYTEIDDLLDVIEEDKARGIKLMENCSLSGEPKFISVHLRVNVLRENYKWTDNDFDELGNNMRGSRVSWKKIERILNHKNRNSTEEKN